MKRFLLKLLPLLLVTFVLAAWMLQGDGANGKRVIEFLRSPRESLCRTVARQAMKQYRQGKALQTQAKRAGTARNRAKACELETESRASFLAAANTFKQAHACDPSGGLALKCQLIAGQCYMRAECYADAVEAFEIIIDMPEPDPKVVPEALYWCADAHIKLAERDPESDEAAEHRLAAYRRLKRLTWDYPSGKWSKYGRRRFNHEWRFRSVDEG